MSNTVEIETGILRAALYAVSYDKGRDHLHGVYFDKRGWLAATNGHVMFAACVPDVADWAGRGSIVSGKQIEQAVKGRSTKNIVVLELDRGNVIVGACGNKVVAPIIDGTFPDWRRILPADCHGAPVPAHFLPGPMQAAYKMAKALDATAYTVARDDPGAPHPVVFGERTDCFAVIMPARMGVDPTRVWAKMGRPL